jgi:hypothetical protein
MQRSGRSSATNYAAIARRGKIKRSRGQGAENVGGIQLTKRGIGFWKKRSRALQGKLQSQSSLHAAQEPKSLSDLYIHTDDLSARQDSTMMGLLPSGGTKPVPAGSSPR